ncbi:GNAT family N-acetyltransferase [Deinococcus yavapaiensis]|uniref:Aminoglycoside 3-N-acetyltransferase I n=1 Tax=Deinococcus yavapaiensis KR-236 TaxID=694435 RepID=A0A318S369_9DEIO|nr:GNAT family N-acetyltransferase [Deinococcus yavapaiensis]PYE52951.1 aminoglycoside 3-N-acetyltransferase I [Deinococcus yavapaiensis KR-236]
MSEHATAEAIVVSELHTLDTPSGAALLIEALAERGLESSTSRATLVLRDFLARGHHVLVARDGGDPVGYLAAVWSFSLSRGAPVLLVQDLFVQAERRRRGVATALLERAEALAVSRFACRLELGADLGDAPAQALYERRGFDRIQGRAVRMKLLPEGMS